MIYPVQGIKKNQTNREIFLGGKIYLSPYRAGELFGYHRDYLSKLARAQKIECRKIGIQWFLEKKSLESFVYKRRRSSPSTQIGSHTPALSFLERLPFLPQERQKNWEREYGFSPAPKFDLKTFHVPLSFISLILFFGAFGNALGDAAKIYPIESGVLETIQTYQNIWQDTFAFTGSIKDQIAGTAKLELESTGDLYKDLEKLILGFTEGFASYIDQISLTASTFTRTFLVAATPLPAFPLINIEWELYNPISSESIAGLQEGFDALTSFDWIIAGYREAPRIAKDAKLIVNTYFLKSRERHRVAGDQQNVFMQKSRKIVFSVEPINWAGKWGVIEKSTKENLSGTPKIPHYLGVGHPSREDISPNRDWRLATGSLLTNLRASLGFLKNIQSELARDYKNSSAAFTSFISKVGNTYHEFFANILSVFSNFWVYNFSI